MRWNGCTADNAEVSATGEDNTGRIQEFCSGERGQDEPGTVGMADGLSESIYRDVADTESIGLQGRTAESLRGGGYITDIN